MRILTILGARPQFIKAESAIRETYMVVVGLVQKSLRNY